MQCQHRFLVGCGGVGTVQLQSSTVQQQPIAQAHDCSPTVLVPASNVHTHSHTRKRPARQHPK
jgi:hypothetical protein